MGHLYNEFDVIPSDVTVTPRELDLAIEAVSESTVRNPFSAVSRNPFSSLSRNPYSSLKLNARDAKALMGL
jgi:hypothetical protein